jgi:hypothetical protein
MSERHISAKKAWAQISERAQLGEKFGFIACLGILYKGGFLSRGQVLEQLKIAKISRDDLVKFREHSGDRQSGQVRAGAESTGGVWNSGEKTGLSHQKSAAKSGNTSLSPNAAENVLRLPLRP